MKSLRKLAVAFMALVMVFAMASQAAVADTSGKVSTKQYTVSKSSGEVPSGTKITVKVKAGYKVYYSTTEKFTSLKKVINSGKKKTFTIKTDTSIRLLGMKASKKIKSALKEEGEGLYIYSCLGG